MEAPGEPILWITLAVMLVGLAGSVLPGVPGVPLIFLSALLYAIFTNFDYVGTLSPGFPTTPGAFDTAFTGESEGFVTKLNSSGSALDYSTFLRGAGASAVAVDAGRNAWLAGGANSATAPTTPDGFDTTHNGGSDAWIGELNASGSALLYATFQGGTNSESGSDVALDSTGNVYVMGHTYSSDFPTTPGAFDRVFNGDPAIFWGDAFVTKLGSGAPAPPPQPAALSSLSLSPTGVTGGSSSTGTVMLTSAAPTEGASVALSSSNTAAATVPASVTVPAGSTRATFTVSTSGVSSNTSSTISASYGGVTRTATLAVNAPAATDELIGTLSGGRGEFSWPTNPQNITVRSSLGGSASRTVTLK